MKTYDYIQKRRKMFQIENDSRQQQQKKKILSISQNVVSLCTFELFLTK